MMHRGTSPELGLIAGLVVALAALLAVIFVDPACAAPPPAPVRPALPPPAVRPAPAPGFSPAAPVVVVAPPTTDCT